MRAPAPVTVRIPLKARPQGSKRHVGGGRLLEMAGEPLKAYRAALGHEARTQMRLRDPITTPIGVSVVFRMKRPLKHYTKQGLRPDAPLCCYPAARGDIDKLLRATLDAFSGIVYADDRQVVALNATVLWGDADETSVLIHPVEDLVGIWANGLEEGL